MLKPLMVSLSVLFGVLVSRDITLNNKNIMPRDSVHHYLLSGNELFIKLIIYFQQFC